MSDIRLNLDTYGEYVLAKFYEDNKGISMSKCFSQSIWIRGQAYFDLLKELNDLGFIFSFADGQSFGLSGTTALNFRSYNTVSFEYVTLLSPDREYAKKIENIIKKYDTNSRRLTYAWVHSPNGDYSTINEEWNDYVTASSYPYIKDFDNFAEDYKKSKSNILILQGPPGTGKTTFIKNLLLTLGGSTMVSYDEKILASDGVFANFIEGEDYNSFVIEDADNFLKSRETGNNMITRFLNVGDGLIKLNKKLIFSTNLANINDIDSALTRPGRCFDIVNFRNLTLAEARVVAKERDLILDETKDVYSLAEIFNSRKMNSAVKKFGFC